jgi:hypothetical protein
VVAYAELVTGLLPVDRAAATRRAGEAVALMPRLTMTLPSPGRDLARGLLLATVARATPASSQCTHLAAAQMHLDAAAARQALSGPHADALAWVRSRSDACHAGGRSASQPRS